MTIDRAAGRTGVSKPVPGAGRVAWMDAVRGTAIILLLLYHCTAIPLTLGVPMPTALRWFSTFFMPYRMPSLMVLSGMLLARSLRKPLPQYFAGKVAGIVWPYLVWVVIAKFVWLDAAGEPWWEWRAWYATSYLWFLFFLGCYYLIAPALRLLPVWLPVGAAWVLAVLLVQGSVEQRLAYFAMFFFAGHAIAGGPRLIERLTPRYRLRLYGLLAVVFGAASVIWTMQLVFNPWFAPLNMAGILLAIGWFRRATGTGPVLRAVRFVGRTSLVYYLVNSPLIVAITMPLVDVLDPWSLAGLNLLAVGVVGTVLALVRQRPPWRWLFRAPGPVPTAVATVFKSAGVLLRAR